MNTPKTRTQLRRFWDRLLGDLEAGRTISLSRCELAQCLACSWHT